MQADVLLVYTIATTLQVDGHTLDPAHKLSLGDQPEVGVTVNSTASLAFVDVRTGYVYATTQADAAMTDLADAWQSETALDAKRMAAEQKRSEEHTSELQSLMRISYAVFCLKIKTTNKVKLLCYEDII